MNITCRRPSARIAISPSKPNDTSGSIRIVSDTPRFLRQTIRPISRRSRLAPLPPGAAVARSYHPTGASDGGGRGERFPLVGQSERGVRTLGCLAARTPAHRGDVLRHATTSAVATHNLGAARPTGHEQHRRSHVRLESQTAIAVAALAQESTVSLHVERAVAGRCCRPRPALDERIRQPKQKSPLVDAQRAVAVRVARRIRQAFACTTTIAIARRRASYRGDRIEGRSRASRNPEFQLRQNPRRAGHYPRSHPFDGRSR